MVLPSGLYCAPLAPALRLYAHLPFRLYDGVSSCAGAKAEQVCLGLGKENNSQPEQNRVSGIKRGDLRPEADDVQNQQRY